jgi:ABC-type sugar transport system, periplasmic component
MKKIVSLILTIAVLIAFTTTSMGFTSIAVKSIKLNSTSVTIQVGKTYMLKVTITPANATNKKFTFSSANKNVATVDSKGIIKAIKAGKTVITVISASNKKAVAKCNVTVSQVEEKVITLRMFNRVNANVVLDNNPIIPEIEKLTKVKLQIEAPPINNYNDKLQVLMASGDLPDLIYNWGINSAGSPADANYEAWSSSGLLAPLDDKITQYPNLMKNITKEMWNAVKSVNDGKIYVVPRTNVVNHWGFAINQKWLDKLGLKAPTTLSEFTNICKAFTRNDPDGNGKDDTFGISFSNPTLGANSIWNASYYLASAFDLPIVNGAKDTDGRYKIREKMSGYIPFLEYIKKLNDDKIIDPEFLINKIYVDRDKFNAGRVGMWYGHQSNVFGNLMNDPASDQKNTYCAPLKDSKGVATDYITPAMWGGWMISKDCKQIDRALKFLDWGNTPEANILLQLGIKGVTYDSYDQAKKLVTRSAEQKTKLDSMTSAYMTIANAINGTGAIVEGVDTQARLDKYTREFNAAQASVTALKLPAVRAQKINNLNTLIPDLVKEKDDMEMKFILGTATLQQFKDFLEKKWYPATADAEKEYIDAMNKIGK